MKEQRTASAAAEFSVPYWVIPVLRFITQHWLVLITLLAGVYFLLALIAPISLSLGWIKVAEAIYSLYSHTCHQLPKASYFLLGQEALLQIHGDLDGLRLDRSFLGETKLGYKTALCQRNLATYGTLTLMGLASIVTGLRPRPLPFWTGGLLIVPMAADGLSQMLGLRESYWLLRSITGFLFSTSLAWTLWPRIQHAMDEVRQALDRIRNNSIG